MMEKGKEKREGRNLRYFGKGRMEGVFVDNKFGGVFCNAVGNGGLFWGCKRF